MTTPFDDDYPTCKETFATLRMFSDSVPPEEMGALLELEATDSFSKGDVYGSQRRTRSYNMWELSTRGHVGSRDARRHLEWILDRLESRYGVLTDLRLRGCEIDVACYWVSTGQGGPTISPAQMCRLADLDLEVWWDVYFDREAES